MEEMQGEEEGQECRPRVFGYNSSQAERMYPSNVTFAPCCLAPFDILTLDKSKRRVNITCQEEETPYIAVGLKRKEEKLGGEKVFLDWKIRPDGEEMGDREYVFGRCGRTWTEGLLVNWFNASAAARADSTVRTLRERQGLPGNYRPLAVYMVMLDSVSRLHFNRSFPHTMRYLRNASQYEEVGEMYDFEVNNAAGGNTAPNMIPLLFGHSLSTHQSRLHNLTLADLQESSLWKTYERAGFVTLLGYDSVWDYLSKYIGKDVATDHVVANFYKAAKKIFGYEDNLTKPRCFGCSNAHNYLLNYLSDYHSNYHGFNRFAYLHLSPGHEKTGLVIRTADQDLLNFLEKMVQNAAKNPNEDMVLMVKEHIDRVGPRSPHFTE